MVARFIRLGAMAGVAAAVSLGLAPLNPAEAVQPGWGMGYPQGKRVQFRPLGYASRRAHSPVPRWRPSGDHSGARSLRTTGRGYPYAVPPGGGRSLAPVLSPPPPSEPATVVRPDQPRFRPHGGVGTRDGMSVAGLSQDGRQQLVRLHAQFRPNPVTKRKRYEDLLTAQRVPPSVYPRAPGPAYGLWRAW